MKRIISIILVTILFTGLISSIYSCKKQENEELTKAAWIDILASQYGLNDCYSNEQIYSDIEPSNPNFKKVQACAEWGIIEKSDEFYPDDNVTNGFAAVAAVKAIGIDRLEKSDYNVSLKTDDEILDFFNSQSGLNISADEILTTAQAEKIISAAQAISNGMVLPQVYEVNYNDNVQTMNLNQVIFSADGKTATIKSGTVNIGDIIVVEPNEYLPRGKYSKVTSINGSVITYEEASIDEICNDLIIQGTYVPTLLGFVPLTSGIEINIIDNYITPQDYRHNKNSANDNFIMLNYNPKINNEEYEITQLATYKQGSKIEVSIGKDLYEKKLGEKGKEKGKIEAEIEGTVTIKDISVTVDIPTLRAFGFDTGIPNGEVYVKTMSTIESDLSIKGTLESSNLIPFARFDFGVVGIAGFSAELYIKVGVEGEISVGVSVTNTASLDFKPFREISYNKTSTLNKNDLSYKAKVFAHFGGELAFYVGSTKLVSTGAYSGLDVEVTPASYPDCKDGLAFIPGVIYFKYDIFGFVNGGIDYKIWHKDNSPFIKNFHIEDTNLSPMEWKFVDKCTKDKTDTNKSAIDNFEDPPIDDDFIDYNTNGSQGNYFNISAYYIALNPNNTDSLVVTNIPDGYSAGDILFTSDNPNVVIVNNSGEFTTVNEGIALIRVATSDGEYEQFCVVSSFKSFNTNFERIPPSQFT